VTDVEDAVKVGSRLVVVSVDSHVGPQLDAYGPYCPADYVDDFDAFLADYHENGGFRPRGSTEVQTDRSKRYFQTIEERYATDPLNSDIATRVQHLDEDGVAVEVVYHGGFNGIPIPFMNRTLADPISVRETELRKVGIHMYNEWVADWASQAPGRLLPTFQVPFWDQEATLAEIRWAVGRGFRAMNLPAPVRSLPTYNQPFYEPLWKLCSDSGLTLHTHGGGGEIFQVTGPGSFGIFMTELHHASRRGMPQMIFGGVFERYPDLKLLLTEQSGGGLAEALKTADSAYLSPQAHRETPYIGDVLPRLPSDYFRTNCFIGGSFMARAEAEEAVTEGWVDNLLWGRDYPHPEGTWPYTSESIRMTFAGLPDDAVRAILGETSISVLGLDEGAVRAVADRVGPTLDSIHDPLGEAPAGSELSLGFRRVGSYA
jgi:predicted TIM-barrel fold metal-dependent hydrolase